MSKLDNNDFFAQIKKDRDDRLAKTILKQSDLDKEEELFWENYMIENNTEPTIETETTVKINAA